MRTVEEIDAEIKKVKTAKRNSERKHARCVKRLEELNKEKASAEAGTSKADANPKNQVNCTANMPESQG